MTSKQILSEMRKAGKPIQIARFYQLVWKLDLKPSGARQKPQHWPNDTAQTLLQYYGIFPAGVVESRSLRGPSQETANERPAGKLISARALRAAKPTTKKGTK